MPPAPACLLVSAEAFIILKAVGFELAFTISVHANGPFLVVKKKKPHSISLRVNVHFLFSQTTHPIF